MLYLFSESLCIVLPIHSILELIFFFESNTSAFLIKFVLDKSDIFLSILITALDIISFCGQLTSSFKGSKEILFSVSKRFSNISVGDTFTNPKWLFIFLLRSVVDCKK